MKTQKSIKGFTLIELLIVIAIIGILAVAFLPSILGAPAKGRDAARIADLQKIQKVLLNANLEGKAWPSTNGPIKDTLATGYTVGGADWGTAFKPDFGGEIPADPMLTTQLPSVSLTGAAAGRYYYKTTGVTNYSFGLYALVENWENANSLCDAAASGTITAPTAATPATNLCYAILSQ